jgi:hypothetical protein
MAAPVKLTKAEGIALAEALAARVGHANVLLALVSAIGAERATGIVERQEGRISKAETLALVKAIIPLVPGDTLKAKIKVAIAALREVIPDKARQDAILAYVVQRIKDWKNPPPVSDPSAVPPWDACTRASCWNGSNAQQRMMNVLSPGMSADKFAQYRDWMLSLGCNAAHVFLSNKADGENAGFCIYGNAWTWTPDAVFCATMRDRIADLRSRGMAVVVWLFADDSAAWNKEAKKNFPRYLADLKAQGLLDQASTVVAGLELEEYFGSSDVSALINAIRQVYPGKVGTHEASGHKFAALADIVFLQTKTGLSPAQIKAAVAAARKNTGKPVNCFEIERHPASTEQIEAAFAGGAFAVGNWNGKAQLVNNAYELPVGATHLGDDVDLSKAEWVGKINGANALVTDDIAPFRHDKTTFYYKQTHGTKNWKPRFTDNGKDLNSAACLAVWRDGRWRVGRFDDCSETRNTREKKNIVNGYLKGIRPVVGEPFRFLLVNADGKYRTKARGGLWTQ